MANVEKTVAILLRKFGERTEYEKRKIVFWYDREHTAWSSVERKPTEDLEETVQKLAEYKINFHLLLDNYFATKKLLEVDDPESDFLIYSPRPEPEHNENWLLDVQLYSGRYESTRLGDIKTELDVYGYALDDFFEKHFAYFADKRRMARFKQRFYSEWTEGDCYLGLLSILTGTSTMDTKEILRNLLMEGLEEDENKYWKKIERYGLSGRFWDLASRDFGYKSKSRYLRKLFLSFIITHVMKTSKVKLRGYNQYMNENPNESEIFLQRWLTHVNDAPRYDELSRELLEANNGEIETDLTAQLGTNEIGKYMETESVAVVDKNIIRKIIAELGEGNVEYDLYLSWIEKRRTKHWFSTFQNLYCALEAAIYLFRFAKDLQDEDIGSSDLRELFKRYSDSYYKMDYYYRRFYYYYDKEKEKEILKLDLRERIENLYGNNLLNKLLDGWSSAISTELDEKWKIGMTDDQEEFYKIYVRPVLTRNDRDRIAVIISDALRYECAVELKEALDREMKGTVELKTMLGNVPSYTALGMASLLPHKKLTYRNEQILADGMSTQGIENRRKILKKNQELSLAIKFNKFMDMDKDQARQWVKGNRVFYIYHDKIDAAGDEARTEHNVFNAVNETFEDLVKIIKRLGLELSFAKIVVTTDHGFMYKRDPLEKVDKLEIEGLDNNERIKANKRFIISKKEVTLENAHKFNISHLSDSEEKLYTYVPKTNLRFKLKGGGINFVHGGVSPQESVIPVLLYSHVRQDADLDRRGIKHGKVGLAILNPGRKIASTPFVIRLFQTERVTDKMEPMECKVALWDLDGGGNKISDEKKVIANSNSDNPAERQQKVTLTISKNIKNKVYYLRLIDEDPKAIRKDIIDPVPFDVNIMIIDDF